MRIHLFPWKSPFLASFAIVPAATLAGQGSSDAGVASDFGRGILFALLIAVPVSFVAEFFVGAPFILLLRPYKFASLLAACAIGIALPFLMFFGDAPFRTNLMASSSGVAVAVAAYFLRPRNA